MYGYMKQFVSATLIFCNNIYDYFEMHMFLLTEGFVFICDSTRAIHIQRTCM